MAQLRNHPIHPSSSPGSSPGPSLGSSSGREAAAAASGAAANGVRGLRLPSLRLVETPPRFDEGIPALTRREGECLGWCAEGKSYWETAVILGITERTVSFHMEAVRSKLDAGSNAHAVAIAGRAGLFERAPT